MSSFELNFIFYVYLVAMAPFSHRSLDPVSYIDVIQTCKIYQFSPFIFSKHSLESQSQVCSFITPTVKEWDCIIFCFGHGLCTACVHVNTQEMMAKFYYHSDTLKSFLESFYVGIFFVVLVYMCAPACGTRAMVLFLSVAGRKGIGSFV